MAKQGMKRPEIAHRKNEMPPVPEISGKARSGKEKAAPPYETNDLAVENLRDDFDLTVADVQDLEL